MIDERAGTVGEHAGDATPTPPRQEPRWLLPVGALALVMALAGLWLLAGRQTAPSQPWTVLYARLNTYIAAANWHQDLSTADERPVTLSFGTRDVARTAGELWGSAAGQAPDPAVRGKLAVCAALTYSLANEPGRGHDALQQVMSEDPARAAVYAEFLPLLERNPRPSSLTPDAEALLADLAVAPYWRAQQAMLRGDRPGAIVALAPAARSGERAITIDAMTRGLGGWVTLLGTIALVVTAVWRGLRDREDRQRPFAAVPWGIGAALLALAAEVTLAIPVSWGVHRLLVAAGLWQPWLIMALASLTYAISTAIVLPVFLRLHGCRPWDGAALGWRWQWRSLWQAPAALVLCAPVYAFAGVMAGWLNLQDSGGQTVDLTTTLTPAWGIAAVLLAVAAVGPFLEETWYRGVLQPAIGRRLRAAPTLVLVAAVFAAAHGGVGMLLPVFALGLVFGILAWRTSGLWASFLTHGLFNLYQVGTVFLLTWAARG